MLRRVITGGQTGVDQAAWRAAVAAGLAAGGWMPRGFATEDGPRPEFAELFGAMANDSDDVADRTIANVTDADATLILRDSPVGPGTTLTVETCRRLGRPHRIVVLDVDDPAGVSDWIAREGFTTLNVAGDRESTVPGIGRRAEAYLESVFRAVLRCGDPDGPLH